ncbi:hypothetical protein GCM10009789_67840 [Kribbella sancticallisti]|uniref:Uncharacterized protein n=1 Tax=Kribbella sancticallisti TaxID=460087 RepID=A0ABN2EE03_9ACTN
MSTPHQGPGAIRRLAAGVSRWRNTRRGTSTLKAAYAQAARDVKRMDPAMRAAVGRSGMTKDDLKHLAQANTAAMYGPNEARFARQLTAQAAAQVQATTPAAQRTRNPFKKLSNRVSRWQETRKGTATLKAAYAQAARDVKRMDPSVREAIGRSRVSKQDLKLLSQAQMTAPLQAGVQQAAQQHQAEARARAAAQAARGPGPAHAAPSESAGQRVANAVNTASRWAKAVKTYPTEKAKKFHADYTERRQNPTGRSARPQPAAQASHPVQLRLTPIQPAQAQQAPAQPGQAQPGQAQPGQAQPGQAQPGQAQPGQVQPGQVQPAQVQPAQGQTADERAALAKAVHAGLNNNMPNPAAEAAGTSTSQQEQGAGKAQLQETQRFANLVTPAGGQTPQEAAKPQSTGPAESQKTGGGSQQAPDKAAAAAFSGVAGASGATKPSTAQSTTKPREQSGAGRGNKPDGREQ